MEFNEKLQQLRKRKGLTQEELASQLYVSRTAISKWESGRGYPNIDSLKEISKFFSVSIDDLLSGNELLSLAEEDRKQKEMCTRSLTAGLLDICIILFFFLPFFNESADGSIISTSLSAIRFTSLYLKTLYYIVSIGIVISGIFTLALMHSRSTIWLRISQRLSLILNIVSVLLFIASKQPYAAAFAFVFLMIKLVLLIKKP